MRMVADSMRANAKPLRLSYFGQCFRYEESKKGRYREFYQYGIEHIGASGPLVEAEVIALAIRMMQATGLQDWTVRIGHVGVLRRILEQAGIDDWGDSEDFVGDAMRLLDKGDYSGFWEMFQDNIAMDISDDWMDLLANFVGASGKIQREGDPIETAREMFQGDAEWHKTWRGILDDFEVTIRAVGALAPTPPKLEIDFTISRGLDYYTGMVFEFHVPALGGESQVLGGGSYRLMHLFDQPDLDPCCGFGLGFDRVLLAMENENISIQKQERGQIAVIPLGDVHAQVLPIVGVTRQGSPSSP